jgi:hypothetical protein
MATVFLDRKGADGGIHATWDHNNFIRILQNIKKHCIGPFRMKAWNADMRCSAPL